MPGTGRCGLRMTSGRSVSWRSSRSHGIAPASARKPSASGRGERAAAAAKAARSSSLRSNHQAAVCTTAVATSPVSAMRSPCANR